MNSKTTLITGGKGFIGSHLKDRLLQEGYRVIVVDKPEGDICDAVLSEVFKKERPALVFHYAAQADIRASLENPGEDARVNILGTWNVLENCARFGVKKVVFASSAAVYGEAANVPTPENDQAKPISPYGIAKLTGELYLKHYYETFGLPFVALRLSNVYGPRQERGAIPAFLGSVLAGKQPVVDGDGSQTRDFVFVKDVVEASMLAAKKDVIGIFNVGTGKETSLNELLDCMQKVLGKEINVFYDPKKSGGQQRSSLAVAKAKKAFAWEPAITLQQGLAKIVESLKKADTKFV